MLVCSNDHIHRAVTNMLLCVTCTALGIITAVIVIGVVDGTVVGVVLGVVVVVGGPVLLFVGRVD